MDINQRLSEAIEKRDWELVETIQAELNGATKVIETPQPKKRGRPKKTATTESKAKNKSGRKKDLSKEVANAIAAKKELSKLETFEYSPPAGTQGYKRPNLFEDDLSLHSEDIGIVLTKDINHRSIDRVSEYVAVKCSVCGFETRVHPSVTIRGVDAGGVSRGYKCDKCLTRE